MSDAQISIKANRTEQAVIVNFQQQILMKADAQQAVCFVHLKTDLIAEVFFQPVMGNAENRHFYAITHFTIARTTTVSTVIALLSTYFALQFRTVESVLY